MLFSGLLFGFAAAQSDVAATQVGNEIRLEFQEGISIEFKLYQIDPIAGEYIQLQIGEVSAASVDRMIRYEAMAGGMYQLDYKLVSANGENDAWISVDPAGLLSKDSE